MAPPDQHGLYDVSDPEGSRTPRAHGRAARLGLVQDWRLGAGYAHSNVYGINRAVDSGTTPEDVWTTGGEIVVPTQARVHEVVSSSLDDAASGTGMRALHIRGLDSNYLARTDTIDLDGTTPVVGKVEFLRVTNLMGIAWGSAGVNAGVVTATAQVDGTVSAEIAIDGYNRSLIAAATVPVAGQGHVTNYFACASRDSPGNSTVRVLFLARNSTDSAFGWYTVREMTMTRDSGSFEQSLVPALIIPEFFDIKMQVASVTANNTIVIAGFDIVQV